MYDSNGNMTNDGANSLGYDAENHMVSAAGWSYAIDGGGLRARKCTPNCSSPTSNTIYVFSGAKVIAEYDNGAVVGSPSMEYIYLGGRLLAKFEGSTTTYYHQDHLSNRVTTNTSGSIVAQNGHFPFGENWFPTTNPDKLKFTSYERDGESSNDYAIARSHINRFGRFSSPDPMEGSIVNPQSLNRYAYVLNNPSNLTDPLGLDPCDNQDRFRSESAYIAYCEGISHGGGGITGCTLDGVAVPCDMANRVLSQGAAVRCGNNDCGAQNDNGHWCFWGASPNGTGACIPTERPGTTFADNEAALAAGALWAQAESIDTGYEHCGLTYGTTTAQYSFTSSVEGDSNSCSPGIAIYSLPSNAWPTGGYHGHGRNDPSYNSERFSVPGDYPGSNGDTGWASINNLPFSLATPGGRLMIYFPSPNCQKFLAGSPAGTGTTIPVCP
ncbi:MAG: DUF4329 domain-containing protein [Acidobacteria bacterium]|nr:DUF4329 domain-containing protein [Acidobacteriota bacterium]